MLIGYTRELDKIESGEDYESYIYLDVYCNPHTAEDGESLSSLKPLSIITVNPKLLPDIWTMQAQRGPPRELLNPQIPVAISVWLKKAKICPKNKKIFQSHYKCYLEHLFLIFNQRLWDVKRAGKNEPYLGKKATNRNCFRVGLDVEFKKDFKKLL